jgi:hypothetical protein
MVTYRRYFIICTLLCLWGCEQFLEVELPDQEPRLVLNALLENTDTLQVFLSRSRSVLEGGQFENDGFPAVRNAQISLRDEQGNVFAFQAVDRSLPWFEDYFYQLPNPGLQAGQTYEITAEAPGFSTIKSSQQLPEVVRITSISIADLGRTQNSEFSNTFEVSLQFNDPPGRNFYEISGSILGKNFVISEGDTIFFFYSDELRPDPVNRSISKDHLLRNVLLFDDVFVDANNPEIVFRMQIPVNTEVEVTLVLSHVTEAYYRYYDTADLQFYNRGDFLSQPVLVFNNIQQGLGIFKARSADRRVLSVRVD